MSQEYKRYYVNDTSYIVEYDDGTVLVDGDGEYSPEELVEATGLKNWSDEITVDELYEVLTK